MKIGILELLILIKIMTIKIHLHLFQVTISLYNEKNLKYFDQFY